MDDRGMKKPIYIFGENMDEHVQNDEVSIDDYLKWQKAREQRIIGRVFMGLVAFTVVGFLTPLFVFLTRLAGGW